MMNISRRDFLGAAAALAVPTGTSVRIKVDTNKRGGKIPSDFLGLGYEISSVAVPGLLSAQNEPYVQLVRNLSPAGVIRIGGITADYATYSPNGQPVSSPKGTVINQANLRDLASFLNATGWKLLWNLNLGSSSVNDAVTEAIAVASETKSNLLAFEIGNEPDNFCTGSFSHRPSSYHYNEWLADYRQYKKAIRAKLPHAQFAGPDVASHTDWVSIFAADEGRDLKLLTHHYYIECANQYRQFDDLLQPSLGLSEIKTSLAAASDQFHLPYRICEMNSLCGGGKQGVSDTFGAALWALDALWRWAHGGCAGVNMETGINQLGFISWYSPIVDNKPKPEYFGMLAFAQSLSGEIVPVTTEAGFLNLSAYAVIKGEELLLTIINKDENDAAIDLSLDRPFKLAQLMRLTAPSIKSTSNVAFEASNLPKQLQVPAASAAVVKMSL